MDIIKSFHTGFHRGLRMGITLGRFFEKHHIKEKIPPEHAQEFNKAFESELYNTATRWEQ